VIDVGIVLPVREVLLPFKEFLVKGAASKTRKTYHTPCFITGRFRRPLPWVQI